MRESFIIHAEYIEDLPDDKTKAIYLGYVYNYGIYDIEPEGLEGFEKSIWIKIKRRIDQDRESYEARKEKNRKRQEEWRKKNGYEPKEEIEVVSDDVPQTEPIPQIENVSEAFSEKVFNIFSNAGLPCQKNNKVSFYLSDFAQGMGYIHQHYKLHSDDVLQACSNYVEVLNDPNCYVSTKLNFKAFVTSKWFEQCLPANFVKDNFKDFKNKNVKEINTETEEKFYNNKPCPSCGSVKVFWSNTHNKYFCDGCKKSFNLGEF